MRCGPIGSDKKNATGYTSMMTDPHVEYIADHGVWLAIPAFLPAIIVVGVVLFIAIRNRRTNKNQD
jgi:hypothetical protein